MSNPKNIQIPYEAFKQLLYVLEYIDLSNYDESFKIEFEGILWLLKEKQNSLEARQAYSKLIEANKAGDEGQQFEARIEYLQKKNTTL